MRCQKRQGITDKKSPFACGRHQGQTPGEFGSTDSIGKEVGKTDTDHLEPWFRPSYAYLHQDAESFPREMSLYS